MTATRADYAALVAKAEQAGYQAGRAAVPDAMVVTGRNPQTGETQEWYVDEGVCGFAWVWVPDGRSPFARWARGRADTGGWEKHWERGVYLWVSEFNQSYDRKIAYARAYAQVLRDAGVTAYGQGRLD